MKVEAKLFLEALHLLADRGLHHVHALGGTAEVKLFGNSAEIAETA